MKLYLREFLDSEKTYLYDAREGWLRSAIEKADEARPSDFESPPDRKIRLSLATQRLDDVFLVKGILDTELLLFCSRTGDPFSHAIHSEFMNYFTQRLDLVSDADELKSQTIVNISKTELESDSSSEVQFVKGDAIIIDPVITESAALEIPLQPLSDAARKADNCIPVTVKIETSPDKTVFSELLKDFKVTKKD